MVQFPNGEFILLKSCEGFICPRVKLLDRSCSSFSIRCAHTPYNGIFSVSYGLSSGIWSCKSTISAASLVGSFSMTYAYFVVCDAIF